MTRAAVPLGVLLLATLLVGVLLGNAAASRGILIGARPTPLTPSPATPSPAPTPTATPIDTAIVASALVVPARSAELAMPLSGRVAAVAVRPEQEVDAGQLLLRLDASTRRAAVTRAAADVRRAEATVERARAELELLPDDATPAQRQSADAELRLAEAELEVARAALVEAEVALAQTELRAPFAGTIVAVNMSQGEQAVAGQSVMTIADLSGWLIETTDLRELDVVRVAVGDRAMITFDALPAVRLSGVVTRIHVRGTSERGGARFGVLIRPDEHLTELRWNMSATTRITPAEQ